MVASVPRCGRFLLPAFLIAALVAIAAAAPASAASYNPFFAAPTNAADFGATSRPLGVAAGDYDGDGKADLVEGRIRSGAAVITFQKGNGDGTFQAATEFPWRLSTFNDWTFTAGDIDGDGNLDLIWGATQAGNSGCTVSPIPSGGTCATAGGQTLAVNSGDVRVMYGNGNGTFQEHSYFVSGVRYAAGTLISHISANGAGSIAVADIDGDNRKDLVAGGVDGGNSVVKLLHNDGGGSFSSSTLISEPTSGTASPIYFPSINATSSPWGLAFGDADADGDQDLWIGDRALYVYLYKNNGSGSFTLTPGDTVVSGTRPNAYLAHEGYRAAVGFTPSLASADVNGDGKADLLLGLQSGTQTPAGGTAHDGELVLDVSSGSAHKLFGAIADIGTMARGARLVDVNGDSNHDVVAGEYDGKVRVLRQLPPLDSDSDGVSDYVDNAPHDANAPRIDMNTDGGVTFSDQLDNDFDTVLGDPEDSSSWQRNGDAADADDDNDGQADSVDNCPLTANPGQADTDGDSIGDACDPLDGRDSDGDNVPTGPTEGDPGYAAAHAAAVKWSTGSTHFVIRIDALGRFFQNEFTQILTDGASLDPAAWQAKCWEDYGAGDPTDPCGLVEGGPVDLPGGKGVPVSLVVIPKQLWSDPEVVDWINDRNDSPLLEIAQHGTYHVNDIPLSDWADQGDRNFFSCEPCGLSYRESYELMKIGRDTLLGNYDNAWVAQSGATASSPKIDWGSSAYPLISYAPPFNTSDTIGRRGIAELGYKAFSASVFEEGDAGTYGSIFTPEGSHHERFDQYGMFHVSADRELDPPAIAADGSYDHAAFQSELENSTNEGGLTTWLIEEVEWSGRPCNDQPRLGTTCNGGDNREDNTVYGPRWDAWMQLLDYVKNHPDSVAMTMGEVALAKAYDNAPTVENAGQADGDNDGVGDVIDGATLDAADGALVRNEDGTLTAKLENGAGDPIADQDVAFHIDTDGDGTDETVHATTGAGGVATAHVTMTRPIGAPVGFSADWDGVRATASDSASATLADTTHVALDSGNPASGHLTDASSFGATLTDSSAAPLAGRTLTFKLGSLTRTATTDASGHAGVSITPDTLGPQTLSASFAGDSTYGQSSDSHAFGVSREPTVLQMANVVVAKKGGGQATATATLKEHDNVAMGGRTVRFYAMFHGDWKLYDTETTNSSGVATARYPASVPGTAGSPTPIRAVFDATSVYEGASVEAVAYKQ